MSSEGLLLEEQARVLKYDQVKHDVRLVHLGDTVSDFDNFDVFDIFVGTLVRESFSDSLLQDLTRRVIPRAVRLDTASRHRDGKLWIPGWNKGQKLPSEALRPSKINGKQFIGRFVNTTATLLNETLATPRRVDILLGTELYSTGRGMIGRSSKILSVIRAVNERQYNAITYTPLDGDNADFATELLMAESESLARAVAIKGLRTAFSGGLPSLGKR